MLWIRGTFVQIRIRFNFGGDPADLDTYKFEKEKHIIFYQPHFFSLISCVDQSGPIKHRLVP